MAAGNETAELSPFVVFTRGALAGQRFDITGESMVFGRDPEGEIVALHDKSVSRRHAELYCDKNNVWFLKDLVSLNGSRVNGDVVRGSHVLHHGDRLSLGDVQLCFWLGPKSGHEQDASHLATIPTRHPVPAGVRPMLDVIEGYDHGLQCVITRDTTVIGRASSGDLILRDPAVDTAHAAIAYIDGSFLLLLLRGQMAEVDGVPVRDGVVLRHGSRIRVGNTQMMFWEDW